LATIATLSRSCMRIVSGSSGIGRAISFMLAC
jgi:hypothetical protein